MGGPIVHSYGVPNWDDIFGAGKKEKAPAKKKAGAEKKKPADKKKVTAGKKKK